MTSTTRRTPEEDPSRFEPLDAPQVIGQRRIRAGHLSLAILLMALGGVLAGVAFYSATRTGDYLAVARPVAAGTELSDADLTVVQMTSAQGLSLVPATDRDQVIGKRARVSLLPGTPLNADAFTDEEVTGPGRRQVGIGVPADRMPATGLYSGDRVLLVATPEPRPAGTAASPPPQTPPLAQYDGVVVGSRRATDATTVIFVAVADADAAEIGTLAAADRIVVILAGIR